MSKMVKLLGEVRQELDRGEASAEAVSQWSVFKQLEHVLVVNESIAELIQRQEEPAESRRRTLLGSLVLTLGYIPRGKGKAPTQVLPSGRSKAELQQVAAAVLERYQNLDGALESAGNRIVGKHPYFGGLTARQWLRFAEIHSAHHLKIVRDIRAKAQ